MFLDDGKCLMLEKESNQRIRCVEEKLGLLYLEGEFSVLSVISLRVFGKRVTTMERQWLLHSCFGHPTFHDLKTIFPSYFQVLM